MSENPVHRRDFLKTSAAAGAALALSAASARRVHGANERIGVAFIGTGGRCQAHLNVINRLHKDKGNVAPVAVCDLWDGHYEEKEVEKDGKKRKQIYSQGLYPSARKVGLKEEDKEHVTKDYRRILDLKDVDVVLIATPDHWHAKIALDAMDHGKDVYLEKPMCHTNEEAKLLVNTVKETKRVLQVGSQTTSADQWWKAKKAIADGMIGQMIMSQGSYHRNSIEGEWNWPIDKEAGPDGKGDNYIDWKTWLGPAQKRPYDADRFFRFRKYWDYSGGIATDLFYHVVAPLQICWGEAQFPVRVSGMGGNYIFKDEREVPDTFNLMADYAAGHSLVLSSSMANSHHIPGLIRGHEGTIIMVENGQFESRAEYITVIPETRYDREKKERSTLKPEYMAKFGKDSVKIPVDQTDMMHAHIENFLQCMRTREKPHLDVETGARAQAVINLAVQSYREGRVLFWDEKSWKASTKKA